MNDLMYDVAFFLFVCFSSPQRRVDTLLYSFNICIVFLKEYSRVVFLLFLHLLHMVVFSSFPLYSPTEMLVCANCIQNPGSRVCICVHEHACCISTVFKRKPTMNKGRSEIVSIVNYG